VATAESYGLAIREGVQTVSSAVSGQRCPQHPAALGAGYAPVSLPALLPKGGRFSAVRKAVSVTPRRCLS